MNTKPKLLYVDDEILFHYLIGEILASSFEMDFANNGKEGLEKALNNDYDIVLMDVSMPIMSGDKSAENIKNVKPDQYIIAMTAYHVSEFNALPFNDYYQKPIKITNIREKLLNVYECQVKKT